jgi:hypothetical protein
MKTLRMETELKITTTEVANPPIIGAVAAVLPI